MPPRFSADDYYDPEDDDGDDWDDDDPYDAPVAAKKPAAPAAGRGAGAAGAGRGGAAGAGRGAGRGGAPAASSLGRALAPPAGRGGGKASMCVVCPRTRTLTRTPAHFSVARAQPLPADAPTLTPAACVRRRCPSTQADVARGCARARRRRRTKRFFRI
jgi:hypothetical protein